MSRGESSGRAWPLAFTLTIALAVIARIVALGHWPGINGDEAWYGVTLQEFLSGRPTLLRTPPGNPLNPLHSGPLLFLLRFLAPTPALLRVPEVIWGIGTVLLAYPLLARPLGRRAAHFAVMLIAVSPAAVAYSRFGWDPSGTPFISLLAVGFALRNQPVVAAICLAAGLWVHPTNVFLLPIAAASWGPHASDRYRNASAVVQRRLQLGAVVAVVAAIPPAWWILNAIAHNPRTSLPPVAAVVSRLVSPQAWGDLLFGVASLVSGVSTATFIGGPLPPPAVVVANLAAGLVLVVPIVIGWRACRANRYAPWLLAGIGASLVIFHAVAGPSAMQPGLERYALFLLVPLLIVCALALDLLAETAPSLTTAMFSLGYACSVAVLCGGYFYPIAMRGTESVTAFRTGAEEPKQAAYRAIETDCAGAEVVSVVAEDWWLYWPLRYFAGADPRVHVELMKGAAAPGGLYPAGSGPRPYPHRPDKVYAVVFDGSAAWGSLRSNRTVFTAVDPLQRPILHVIALTSAPE